MPKRGEVWLVDLGITQKTHPAVILKVRYGDADRVIVTVTVSAARAVSAKFK